jgi:hypothetical protein
VSPDIASKALSFLKTASEHVLNKCRKRPLETINEIHAQCKTNECGHYEPNRDRCVMCGCPNLRYKIAWAVTEHPEECKHNPKWKRYTENV